VPMKQAMIFPGQGSQKVGMGKDLANSYPAAKQVFEAVDDALDMRLSSIIWDGNLEELTLTENAQPALMASSMAVLAALETEGIEIDFFDFVAGHSLGEYSALCAAKSISIEDTARLLRRRGMAMQSCIDSKDGAMAAILGLSSTVIEEILREQPKIGICQIANDNDPNQVVISGHRSAVDRVIEASKKRGAKRALLLNVSAPFHCQIMAPAAEVMREALSDIRILRPHVPVVMNTRANSVVDPEQIRSLLVEQIVEMVRWRETVGYIFGRGPATFYEIGAGKVLSGLVKRIVPDARIFNTSSAQDILSTIESLNNDTIRK